MVAGFPYFAPTLAHADSSFAEARLACLAQATAVRRSCYRS